MRTYGRVNGVWTKVETDAKGFDDYVWVTTLIQCLLLNLGESPFYASYGIPAKPAVVQQVFPDFFISRTQQQFASKFASLVIAKRNSPTPTYDINLTTHQGVPMALSIPE